MKKFKDGQAGFSLIEMMVAMAVMLIVAGIVMQAMVQMMKVQGSMANRSEMHSSIRSATELMQQEIGQAGKASLPDPPAPLTSYLMTTAIVGASAETPVTAIVGMNPADTTGMFIGEYLVIDVGNNTSLASRPDNQETVQITALTATNFTATLTKPHLANVPILLQGAFGTGIVPPTPQTLVDQGTLLPAPYTGQTNGSTGYVLKLYGDLNGDGSMQYVEYVCDVPAANLGNPATLGNLYRNYMPYNTLPALKPVRLPSKIVLNNLENNPLNAAGVMTPCFTYYVKPANGTVFVVNVAITLTAQTTLIDPQTNNRPTESKALLNVSPRNVFQAWMLSSAGSTDRVQPMPASIGDATGTSGLISTTP